MAAQHDHQRSFPKSLEGPATSLVSKAGRGKSSDDVRSDASTPTYERPKLKKLSQRELDEAAEKHAFFVQGRNGGSRATPRASIVTHNGTWFERKDGRTKMIQDIQHI